MSAEGILNHSILVSSKIYLPFLFAYKSEHPDLSFKLWSTDDLLDRLCFAYPRDPIPFLLTQSLSYGNAKKVMSLLRLSDFSKNQRLLGYYSSLKERGYLETDPLGEFEIKGSRLVLFEQQENQALKKLLERKGIAFSSLSFPDLGVPQNKAPEILYFPNKLYQFCYLFSEMRKRIKEDPSVKDRLSIMVHDSSDAFYIQFCSALFSLPARIDVRVPLLSFPAVKEKVASFYKSGSLAFTEEERNDPALADLVQMIDHYGLASLPFSFAYANLLEILNAFSIKEPGDPGISVIDELDFAPGKLIFVTNFQHGDFYKVSSDKDILSDKELEEIDANPSYVKTRMDRRDKLNFLLYGGVVSLSRPLQHLNDKIYDSPFLEELGWNKTNPPKKVRWNEGGEYTYYADKLFRTDLLDQAFCREKVGDLLGFDHTFHKGMKPLYPVSKRYSATKLERYVLCPFKFLLDAYFPADPSSIRTRSLGTLNHAIMTSLYGESFDFEASFSAAEKDYRQAFEKEGVPFSGAEEAALAVYKHWLRRVVSALRAAVKTDGGVTFPKEKAEQSVRFSLKDEDGRTYPFSGRIDKILFSGGLGRRYYTIIDYKSGAENFSATSLCFGPSIQLPLYYCALQEEADRNLLIDPKKPECPPAFGGFVIQHTYFSTLKKMAGDGNLFSYAALRKNVRAKGVVRASEDYWDGIDPAGLAKDKKPNGKGKNIAKSLYFSSPDGQETLSKAWPGYTFSSLLEDGKAGAIWAIKKIESDEFPIAPTSPSLKGEDASLQCSHCPYGDICYKNKAADKVDYTPWIRSHFQMAKMEADEGDDDE